MDIKIKNVLNNKISINNNKILKKDRWQYLDQIVFKGIGGNN